MSSKRVNWIDLCKGIAMLMVIVGHSKLTPVFIFRYICDVHMPLFFILSGLVLDPYKYNSFRRFAFNKTCKLLIPTICLNLLYFLYHDFYLNPANFFSTARRNGLIGILMARHGTKFSYNLWFAYV